MTNCIDRIVESQRQTYTQYIAQALLIHGFWQKSKSALWIFFDYIDHAGKPGQVHGYDGSNCSAGNVHMKSCHKGNIQNNIGDT